MVVGAPQDEAKRYPAVAGYRFHRAGAIPYLRGLAAFSRSDSIRFCYFRMQLDVLLACMVCVFVGMNRVTVRDVCVMGGSFVIAFLHLLRGGPMVLRCLLVMVRSEFVKFS